jgi:carboxyl-terminal processing protease
METTTRSKRRRRWILLSGCVAALGAGAALVYCLNNPLARAWLDPEYRAQVLRFGEWMFITNQYYHDKDRAGFENLTDQALIGMTTSLDNYSRFMSAEDFAKNRSDLENNYAGTGFRSWNLEGSHVVARVHPGSPAHRAGLVEGDRINRINGEPASEWIDQDFTQRMRGPAGTEVTLDVTGTGGERTLTIRREKIHTNAVVNHWVDPEGVGFVKLDQFTSRVGAELTEVLQRMNSEGMRGLVLDLRNNGGGQVISTTEVAGLFLPPDSLITKLKSRAPELASEYRTKKEAIRIDLPMVILVNGLSASGSECLAGALHCHDRAVLVGEKTFGKGSAQNDFISSDGSGMKLTTAQYLLPDGSNVDGKGLEPDHPVTWEDGTESLGYFQQAVSGRIHHEEFRKRFGFDPLPDPQLWKALEVLRRSIHEKK